MPRLGEREIKSVHFTLNQYLAGIISAVVTGFAKSGISGMGTLAIPVMAMGFGAKASSGILLPMLITGDIFALFFYRRFAQRKILSAILPYALVGIVLGYFGLRAISDHMLKIVMGILVIVLIGITPLVRKIDTSAGHWKYWLAPLFGVLAGITSMMANAAGALVTLYLLWMNVDKNEFLGTNAWFFFIVNCCKVPFSMHLGLINAQSGLLNLFLVPAVLAGAFAGVWLVKRINQRVFEISVQVLTLVAGIRLLF